MVVGQLHQKRSRHQRLIAQVAEELKVRKLLLQISRLEQKGGRRSGNEKGDDDSIDIKKGKYKDTWEALEMHSVLPKYVEESKKIKQESESKRLGSDGRVPFGAFSLVFLLAWLGAFAGLAVPLALEHHDHVRDHLAQLLVWPLSAAFLTLILFATRLETTSHLVHGGWRRTWVFSLVGAVVMYGVLIVLMGLFPDQVEHGDVLGGIGTIEHTGGQHHHTHDEL